jgi:hypothetical protein
MFNFYVFMIYKLAIYVNLYIQYLNFVARRPTFWSMPIGVQVI